MANVLQPGYVRWTGSAYTTTPDIEIVGTPGPAGPAGPQGLPGSTGLPNIDNIIGLKAFANPLEHMAVFVSGYYLPGDGGGGNFYWDSSSADNDNGGTIIQSDIGGIGRWKRIYSGAISVKSFGAVGNGSTDDTTAIQATFNVASNTGKCVHIPAASVRYKTTATLTVPTGVTVFGDGIDSTIIGYEGSNAALEFAVSGLHIHINDLTIEARSANSTIGIRVASAFESKIERVYVNGAPSNGFTTAGILLITLQSVAVEPFDITMESVLIHSCIGDGLLLDTDVQDVAGPQLIRTFGGVFDDNGGYGIHCTPKCQSTQITVIGTVIEANTTGGFKGDRLHASKISDCHFENGQGQNVIHLRLGDTALVSSTSVEVSGNYFNIGGADYAISSMSTTGQFNFDFHGNEFYSLSTGKSAYKLGPQVDVRWSNNRVYGTWTPVGDYANKYIEQGYDNIPFFMQDEDGIQIDGTLRHGPGQMAEFSKAIVPMGDTNQTLTYNQYNKEIIDCTGVLTADRYLIFPAGSWYSRPFSSVKMTVKNSTTGGFNIKCRVGSTTPYDVAPGLAIPLFHDGYIYGPQQLVGNNRTSDLPIWLVGDSNGVGSGAAFVGGWRTTTECYLRKVRSDFDFVGSVATVATTSSRGSLVWHSCVSGRTIALATTALSSELTLCATTPQAVIECLGTNEIVNGGLSANQILTNQIAYEAALFAALPSAHLFVVAPPIFVAGSSVGGNLSAWNTLRNTYVALLSAHCSNDSRITFIDSTNITSSGDYQEGVHFNKNGNAAMGNLIATAVDKWMGISTRRGGNLPRVFEQRNLAGSLKVTNPASDGARLATGQGGLDMTAASYMISFDIIPTSLSAGPNGLLAMGPRHAEPSSWWLFAQVGEALSLQFYDGSSVGVVGGPVSGGGTGMACDHALKINKLHRIVGIWWRGPTNKSVVGLYCNGKLVGQLNDLASTWLASVQTFFIGPGFDYNGVDGYYSEIHVARGAGVPKPGTMAALRMVEDNYYDDAPLATGYETACYPLDTSLNDDVSANAPLVAQAGGTIVASYPNGMPLRPWEIGIDEASIITHGTIIDSDINPTPSTSNSGLATYLRTVKSYSPLGTNADAANVLALLNSMSGVGEVNIKAGSAVWHTQVDMPGNVILNMHPNTSIISNIGIGNGNILKAVDTTSGSGTLAATPTLGSAIFQSTTLFAKGDRVRVGGTGGTNIHIGSKYKIESVTPGSPNTYTINRPFLFPFISGDPVRLITSRAANIIINGNGATVSGPCDYVVQFQTEDSLVQGLKYISTTDVATFAYSIELSSVNTKLIDCTADFFEAPTSSTGGVLFESNEGCALEQVRIANANTGIWVIDSIDGTIEKCNTTKARTAGLLISCHPTQTAPGCQNMTVKGGGFHSGGNTGVQVGYATNTKIIGVSTEYNIDGINIGAGTTTVGTKVIGSSTKANSNYGLTVRSTATGTKVSGTNSKADGSGFRVQGECDFFGCDILDCTVNNNYPLFIESSMPAGVRVNFSGGRISSSTASIELVSVQGPSITTIDGTSLECNGSGQIAIKHYATAIQGMLVLNNIKSSGGSGTSKGYVGGVGNVLRKYGRNDFSSQQTPFTLDADGYVNSPTGNGIPQGSIALNGASAVDYRFPDVKADDSVKLTLRVRGGTVGPAPGFVITAGNKVTLTGTVNDTSTYDIEIG